MMLKDRRYQYFFVSDMESSADFPDQSEKQSAVIIFLQKYLRESCAGVSPEENQYFQRFLVSFAYLICFLFLK